MITSVSTYRSASLLTGISASLSLGEGLLVSRCHRLEILTVVHRLETPSPGHSPSLRRLLELVYHLAPSDEGSSFPSLPILGPSSWGSLQMCIHLESDARQQCNSGGIESSKSMYGRSSPPKHGVMVMAVWRKSAVLRRSRHLPAI